MHFCTQFAPLNDVVYACLTESDINVMRCLYFKVNSPPVHS